MIKTLKVQFDFIFIFLFDKIQSKLNEFLLSFVFRSEYLNNLSRFVWNEEETTNGNASLLKALSVVVETEDNDEDTLNEAESINKEVDDVEREIPPEEPKDEQKTDDNDEEKNGDVGVEQSENAIEEHEINDTNDNAIESESNAENMPEVANENSNEKIEKSEETKSSERTTPVTPATSVTPIALFKKKNHIKVQIPPIWTPTEKRANAALIYLYFRSVSLQVTL